MDSVFVHTGDGELDSKIKEMLKEQEITTSVNYREAFLLVVAPNQIHDVILSFAKWTIVVFPYIDGSEHGPIALTRSLIKKGFFDVADTVDLSALLIKIESFFSMKREKQNLGIRWP